ncbi:MAG: hypothetical protein V3S23_07795 [Kiloniellales bacterium]
MAQHDYNIANADGATVRADLNSALLATVSLNSGATEPATKFAYQWWADTTVNVLKQRNTANNAWLERAPLGALRFDDFPRSHLAGLTLSNGTDATNDIDIAMGAARNAADDGNLALAAAAGKQIDVTWAAGGTPGAPTGGLSSSLTLTNDTWYHVFLILVSGTVEVGFDTSLTAANLITDHGATKYRRIGSVLRGTATNEPFSQVGDEFLWDTPVGDYESDNPGTSATTHTLTVPTGLQVTVIHTVSLAENGATGQNDVLITSLDQNDTAPSVTRRDLSTQNGSESDSARFHIRTSTSGQIRTRGTRSVTNTKNTGTTHGWVDTRGRDA